MLNYDGIRKQSVTGTSQILANVDMQSSVGCIVSQALGVSVGTRTIAKAGTPVYVDLMNRETTPAVLANGTTAMNGCLIHDVDVTEGNKNGAALIFGFVNYNRLEADVQAKVTTAIANEAASKLVVFLKA